MSDYEEISVTVALLTQDMASYTEQLLDSTGKHVRPSRLLGRRLLQVNTTGAGEFVFRFGPVDRPTDAATDDVVTADEKR